jgi:DNA-binding LacI/PurR family transcriptional regulator
MQRYATPRSADKETRLHMATTIREIAKLAGVSPSTVSRVLNRKGNISKQTQSRVISVARSLGYPVPSDRSKAEGAMAAGTVAIVYNRRLSPLVTDPFYGAVVAGIEEGLQELGYRVFLRSIDSANGHTGLFEQDSSGNHNDGLLLVGCDASLDIVSESKKRDIPVVLVDNESKEGRVDCIVSDNEAAAKKAMQHLYALGHRKIGFIGGPQSHVSLAQRYKGYVSTLQGFGIDFRKRWVVFAESVETHGPEIGYEGTHKLMDGPESPTAIFADNDMTALGALKALHEKGIKVPEEVSVIGFDNIEVSAHTHPPLTTMHIPKMQMGSLAARRLVDLICDKDVAPIKTVVYATLILRDSAAHLCI